jgi:cytochrome c-type biogenesis protein CcmH/NrfG
MGSWILFASVPMACVFALTFFGSARRRVAFLSGLRSSGQGFSRRLRSGAATWMLAVAGFLLVTGIGAVTSFMARAPEAPGSGDTSSLSRSGSNGEILAHLKDYARSVGTDEPAPTAAAGKLLPDVDTMIERLAARLQRSPEDSKGWRMLGWSYFHTARYEQAATAYAKAVALDPNSAELKLAHAEARAKSDNLRTASSLQAAAVGKDGEGLSLAKDGKSEAMPQRELAASIQSMVDGLAHRLERSPRDVEGWARLMRSRVVLGEREVAAAAFRKALEIFKDEPAASGKLMAAATELGLKAE